MTKTRDFANLASGLTATATELNILDGATVTTGEVNYNDITALGTAEASKAVTADASGNVDIASGDISDQYGNVRDVPLGSSKTSSYTLLASDAGNAVVLDTGGSVVVPTSVLSAGNIVTIVNAQNATATITTSALTSYISGDATDVTSATIDPRGLCTLYFASSSVVYMSGNIS